MDQLASTSGSSHDHLRVLAVIGTSRSGSTILGKLLGSLQGVENLGEIRKLSSSRGRTCGCGTPLSQCRWWQEVRSHLEEGIPSTSFLSGAGAGRLFAGVRATTGAQAVVDTSKDLGFALELASIPNASTTLIHLVRDPRGVAFSAHRGWRGRGDDGRDIDLIRLLQVTAAWSKTNLAVELARKKSSTMLRVRYEDLTAEPESTIRRIITSAGLPMQHLPLQDRILVSDQQHTVAGNPVRYSAGRVLLREDREWRDRMSPSRKLLGFGLAFPLSAVYGYGPLD